MSQQPHAQNLVIAIVVGEVSGDSLGAALMRDFRARGIAAEFVGIGGPQMLAEGFHSLYPMEQLAVMGLVEVLKHLKSLFAVRDGLLNYFEHHHIDLYIGIDAPDFNLRVAKQIKLRQLPIKTVQYVSPSVWAWRPKRVFAIKRAIDVVLCLFPFEVDFYRQYNMPAYFVGHPLAQQLPLQEQPAVLAQQALGLNTQQHYLAVLPGSRHGEIARLLPDMLKATRLIHEQRPEINFIIPAVNTARATQIQQLVSQFLDTLPQSKPNITIVTASTQQLTQGNIGRLTMQAADAVLLSSGTATLEALLLHRPMVSVYRLHWLTYSIVSRMVNISYYALPNIIAKQPIVEELIQKHMTPYAMAEAVLKIWHTPYAKAQQQQLQYFHQTLQQPQEINAAAILIHYFHLN